MYYVIAIVMLTHHREWCNIIPEGDERTNSEICSTEGFTGNISPSLTLEDNYEINCFGKNESAVRTQPNTNKKSSLKKKVKT